MDNEKNETKTRDERIKELLDAPAIDAVGKIKGPSLADIAPMQEAGKTEDGETEATDEDSGDKKIRIRKSRLTTLEKEAETFREETEAFKQRVAALEAQLSKSHQDEEKLPDWWIEAYGDNEVSRKGYANQQRIFREELTRQFDAREAQVRAEEAQREAQIETIEKSFDEQMEELEESIGRDLTASQKSELLDIVGEYSPTDGEGKYLAYMPIEKAYELWSKGQSKDESKREMANIAGMTSSGSSNQNSDWRPGGWRQKYGL